MDAPIRLLLERGYGYAKRQNKALGPLSAAEEALCFDAGFPLKKETSLAHDDAVARLCAAAAKLDPETVADAFVAHVGGSFGPGGQALIVYAFARHLEPHAATYQAGYTTCQICGLDRNASVDVTERALRAELGWLWNERDSGWAFDLETLAKEPLPAATNSDRETFVALLALIGSAPSDEKPSELEKRVAASKLLPHTEKYRRYGIFEALGEVGVLPNTLITPSWDAFTTVADVWAASRKAKGGPRSDVVLPFGAWRGELGVDWQRATALFGVQKPRTAVLGGAAERGGLALGRGTCRLRSPTRIARRRRTHAQAQSSHRHRKGRQDPRLRQAQRGPQGAPERRPLQGARQDVPAERRRSDVADGRGVAGGHEEGAAEGRRARQGSCAFDGRALRRRGGALAPHA
jgi:hypothetical protein